MKSIVKVFIVIFLTLVVISLLFGCTKGPETYVCECEITQYGKKSTIKVSDQFESRAEAEQWCNGQAGGGHFTAKCELQ